MSDAPLPAFRIDVGAAELKRALDVLDPLTVGGARFGSARDGITCAAVDPSHIAIEVVRLDRRLFFAYELDRPGSVGVDLVKLRELLKIPRGETSYKKTDRKEAVFSLSFGTTFDTKDRLAARLATGTGAQIVRSMAVIDPSGITDPKVPPHEPTVRADDVDTEALYTTVTGAAKATPAGGIRLNRSKAGIWLRTVPETDGGVGSESEVTCLTLTGAGRAEYPLDFLGKAIKPLKGADSVSLLWSRDRPLKIGFRWGPADRPTVDGFYLIAARVEDEQNGLGWFEHPWGDWYDWAMPGPTDRPAPDLSAACVDSVPTDVIDAEIARVRELGAAQMAAYETALGAYPALAETARARAEAYDTARAGFVARWRETHPRDPAERTIRATVGFRPHETVEPPVRPAAPGPFSDPDRRERDLVPQAPPLREHRPGRVRPGDGEAHPDARPHPARGRPRAARAPNVRDQLGTRAPGAGPGADRTAGPVRGVPRRGPRGAGPAPGAARARSHARRPGDRPGASGAVPRARRTGPRRPGGHPTRADPRGWPGGAFPTSVFRTRGRKTPPGRVPGAGGGRSPDRAPARPVATAPDRPGRRPVHRRADRRARARRAGPRPGAGDGGPAPDRTTARRSGAGAPRRARVPGHGGRLRDGGPSPRRPRRRRAHPGARRSAARRSGAARARAVDRSADARPPRPPAPDARVHAPRLAHESARAVRPRGPGGCETWFVGSADSAETTYWTPM